MGFGNCVKCGRLFDSTNAYSKLCKACQKELDEKFQQVREYIRENPEKNINQIAEENEVSIRQIKQWIREEKLVFSQDSDVTIECEECGKPIRTGRYCNACKKSKTNELTGLYVEKPSEKGHKATGGRMHFLN